MLGRHALALAFGALMVADAAAQSVQLLAEHRDWTAYSALEGAGAVCFAVTKAKALTPPVEGAATAYLYLTKRPAEGIANEFNIVAGFVFEPDQPAQLAVSNRTFELFTRGDSAWLLYPDESASLADALRAGTNVVVKGASESGLRVTLTFSLSGATAASRAIAAC